MKNLANCKPSEFLRQTVKIRKSVAKWLTVNEIVEIRKRKPEGLDKLTDKEERQKVITEQAKKNILEMFDNAFERHPEDTLELLALLCFVDPAEVDDHPVSDYLDSIREMLDNESVVSFFTSLQKLGQTSTSTRWNQFA